MIRFENLFGAQGMQRFLSTILCGFALLLVAASGRCAVASRLRQDGQRQPRSHRREPLEADRRRSSSSAATRRIFAEEVEVFLDEDRAVATGNVTFTQGANRISADRADFNIKTRLGTFYNATGIANVQPPRQRPRPGVVVPPPVAGQENDVYFFGETIEKIGPKKYRITNGGFSTCVQPTPRWDLHAGTVVLNIDHYTMLRQAVLKVKGVPLLYVPVLYYPTKKEGRATGFLMPTYGSSTLRGQQLHNAFFWAIDRSQDATFMHEFFSQVGQGVSGEYRYNFGGGSDGTFNAHFLDQHESTYPQADGTVTTVPASAELRAARRREPDPAGQPARPRERQLLLEHRHEPDLQHEHLQRLQRTTARTAATSSAPGPATA